MTRKEAFALADMVRRENGPDILFPAFEQRGVAALAMFCQNNTPKLDTYRWLKRVYKPRSKRKPRP